MWEVCLWEVLSTCGQKRYALRTQKTWYWLLQWLLTTVDSHVASRQTESGARSPNEKVQPLISKFRVYFTKSRKSPALMHQRRVCVCVSTSVTKSFECRGSEHSLANSVQRSYALEWEAWTDHPCVPAFWTVDHAVPISFFLPWWFHDTSPKPFFRSAACSRSWAAVAILQMRINYLLKHLQVLGPFALRFSRLPSTWPLNNWKPMSECDSLSRPTWVLGVILRKEAPFSLRNSCNRLHRFPSYFGFS